MHWVVDNLALNLYNMKKIFSLAGLVHLLFLSTSSFSQSKSEPSWYSEVHAGWQTTLNAFPYSAQLKQGFTNKPLDSSGHYAAYFKDQLPIEITVGMDGRNGFKCQFTASYYSMKIALNNPPDVQDNEEYLLANAHLLSMKTHLLMDYSSLGGSGTNNIHFIGGMWTGITIPVSMNMNAATTNHFGIGSFQKNMVWTTGLELILTIDISKKFYITNAMSFEVPISGNFGQIKMQDNSSYTAGDPVKTTSFSLLSGVGMHF